MTSTDQRLKVQLIHGLEGSPQGAKARFLAEHFHALCPEMNTRDFEGAVRTQAEAVVKFEPNVVVGSSFGGAVAMALLQGGLWSGPTLLLAPALGAYEVPPDLPPGARVVVVHGRADEVVPVEESRRLARAIGSPCVELFEVDDGHRLSTLLQSGALADWVRRAAGIESGQQSTQ